MDTHGLVLFAVASVNDRTLRQISEELGLTERRIAQVIRDLADADMLFVTKVGRRNSYSVNCDARFRHPTLSHITLGQFIGIMRDSVPAPLPSSEIHPDVGSGDTIT